MHELRFSLRIAMLSSLVLYAFLATAQLDWQQTRGIEGISYNNTYSDGVVAYHCGIYNVYRTTNGKDWVPIHNDRFSRFDFIGDTLAGLIKNYFSLDSPPDSISVSLDNGLSWSELSLPDGIVNLNDFVVTKDGLFIRFSGDVEPGYSFRWYLNFETMTWGKYVMPGNLTYLIFEQEEDLFYFKYWYDTERLVLTRMVDSLHHEKLGFRVDLMSNPKELFVHHNFMSIYADGYFQSFDSGQSWTEVDVDSMFYRPKGILNEVIYGVGKDDLLYQSTDTGRNWTLLNFLDSIVPVKINGASRFGFAAQSILSGNNFGFYLGINPISGEIYDANYGIDEARINALNNDSGILYAAGANGVFRYNPVEERWNHLSTLNNIGGLTYISEFAASPSGLMIAAKSSWTNLTYLMSLDSGLTWTTHSLPWADSVSLPVSRITLLDDIIYFTTLNSQVTFRSDDYGNTWSTLTLESEKINSWPVKWMNEHFVYKNEAIYHSIDSGGTWQLFTDFKPGILNRLFPLKGYLIALVLDGSQSGERVYYSENGIDWRYGSDGLSKLYVNHNTAHTKSYAFEYNGCYFMSTYDQGMFGTPDTFKTWYPVELMYPEFFNEWALEGGTFYNTYIGVRKAPVPALKRERISGLIFYDKNENGAYDTDDVPIPDVNVNLIQHAAYLPLLSTNSDSSGFYQVRTTSPLRDTLRCTYRSKYLKSIVPEYYLIKEEGGEKHFGIQLLEDKTDLSLYASAGLFRPGEDTRITITYKNEGTTEPISLLSVKLDSNLEYIMADPAPDNVIGDSLIWTFGELKLQENGTVNLITKLDPNIALQSDIINIASISSTSTDETPYNNIVYMNDIASSASLSSDKRLDPPKGLTRNEVRDGVEQYYTVRFQNNTDHTVSKVKVWDQIDTTLIPGSIRLISASHEVDGFRVFGTDGYVLEVILDDINLKNSNVDFTSSQGYVTFAAKRKPNVKNHIPTRNTARISFDYNLPLSTNPTIWWPRYDIVSSTINVTAVPLSLNIFPNPASDVITFTIPNGICASGELIVRNMLGMVMKYERVTFIGDVMSMDISQVPTGMYSVELSCGNIIAKGNVVVQK